MGSAAILESGQPEIHRRTTAEELWQDSDGAIDIFVSALARAEPSRA
jgi:cysteine synthase